MLLTLALIALCLVLFSQAGRVFTSENVLGRILRDIGEARDRACRDADASGRERIVRLECGWRVIGRVVAAGVLLTGAFATASPVLKLACTVSAWRVIKPVRREMRDACSYHSTGANDERPYMF